MVIANSSPLIYLSALSDFDLLRELFRSVVIPPAVYEEVLTNGGNHPVVAAVTRARKTWIHIQTPSQPASRAWLIGELGIHDGEAEAIALASETDPDALLMDDLAGYRHAVGLSINVLRTAAIYRLAKQRGYIPSLASKLDQLRRAGFHLREEHYRLILKKAGEL